MQMLNFLPSQSSRLPDVLGQRVDARTSFTSSLQYPPVSHHFERAVKGLWDCVRGLVRKLHRLQLLVRDGDASEKERDCLPICDVLASSKRMRRQHELTVIVLWLVPWVEKFRSSIANCGRPVEFEVACGR